MVEALVGDLFESNAQTLVNTVNTVGVMGKGIALEFKRRFPDMFDDYVRRCEQGQVRLGKPYLFKRLLEPWILNFPTKDHWRSVSRLSDIVAGLEHLRRHYRDWGITSLAVPPLGCGEGQLEWRVVGPTLYRHLNELEIPVKLYAPHGTAKNQLVPEFLSGVSMKDQKGNGARIEAGAVALVAILERILRERYHWPIGRTAFQKLAYFATEAGIPTGLVYQRGSYGPFADGLRPLIVRLVNNGLVRERRLGRMFSVEPGPTYRDAAKRFDRDISVWESEIEKVADLFLRMRTSDAEVAATVAYASKELARQKATRPSEREILDAVHDWKQKRRPPLEVGESIRNLNVLGWIDAEPSPGLPQVGDVV